MGCQSSSGSARESGCTGLAPCDENQHMKQAVWTGAISFGLVNIPVRLYPATDPKDVRFHLYDRRSGKRVRYERVTRVEDAATFAPEPEFPLSPDEREDRSEIQA